MKSLKGSIEEDSLTKGILALLHRRYVKETNLRNSVENTCL